ncbi:hypothetical protein RhiirB3_460853, partial [Rhizophagus irregularis]
QWTAFAIDLDKLCPIDPLVFDAWPLNQNCEYLHFKIIKAAMSQLPSIIVGNTYALKKPKDLESLCQSYREHDFAFAEPPFAQRKRIPSFFYSGKN